MKSFVEDLLPHANRAMPITATRNLKNGHSREPAMNEDPLAGRHVLLAENDPMIAMLIRDLLSDVNCKVLGPFATLSDSLNAAQTAKIDLALLDVSLRDGDVYPLADLLSERRVPFLLLTGYHAEGIPATRPNWRWHPKPFREVELLEKMRDLVD